MSLKYEPSSEPFRKSAKWLSLNREDPGVRCWGAGGRLDPGKSFFKSSPLALGGLRLARHAPRLYPGVPERQREHGERGGGGRGECV